jgi:hypothetical protein
LLLGGGELLVSGANTLAMGKELPVPIVDLDGQQIEKPQPLPGIEPSHLASSDI